MQMHACMCMQVGVHIYSYHLVMYGHERKHDTLSRPAIDEKSKGFAGNPSAGIVGIVGMLPDCAAVEFDPEEVFFTAGSGFSSALEKHIHKILYINKHFDSIKTSCINKPIVHF